MNTSNVNSIRYFPPIRGVIFDLDGTLLDTETLSTEALNVALSSLNCHRTIDWEMKKKILGKKGVDWAAIVIDEFNLINTQPKSLVDAWERSFESLYNQVNVLPGVTQLTTHLSSLRIPMAIATSSNSHAVMLKRHHHSSLFNLFHCIVCGDDPEVIEGKPHPSIFMVAASRLGLSPSQCIAFEDSEMGVMSAVRAGMIAVIAIPDSRLEVEKFRLIDEARVFVVSSIEKFRPQDFDLPAYR